MADPDECPQRGTEPARGLVGEAGKLRGSHGAVWSPGRGGRASQAEGAASQSTVGQRMSGELCVGCEAGRGASRGDGERAVIIETGPCTQTSLEGNGSHRGPEADLHSTKNLSAVRVEEGLRLASGPEPLAGRTSQKGILT